MVHGAHCMPARKHRVPMERLAQPHAPPHDTATARRRLQACEAARAWDGQRAESHGEGRRGVERDGEAERRRGMERGGEGRRGAERGGVAGLRVGGHDGDGAHVVQDVLRRDRLAPDARLREGLGRSWGEARRIRWCGVWCGDAKAWGVHGATRRAVRACGRGGGVEQPALELDRRISSEVPRGFLGVPPGFHWSCVVGVPRGFH